ncbi:MAG TPA: J domain-containing protein [Edaphobacter sp.]|nr:J domain-containing protein [Edaphobacter sp.]
MIQWHELKGGADIDTPCPIEWVELRDKPDCYQYLGIKPTATADEIKRAYRKLAALLHPDHQPSDLRPAAEARMKELNAAYALLRYPQRRAAYDAELSGKTCA